MLTIEFAAFLGQYYWGVIAVSKVVKKLGFFTVCHFWAVTHTCSKLLPTRIIRSWILIFIAHRASNFAGDWFKHLDCIACGWRREPRKSHAPGRWPDKFSFLILNPTRLWQVRMSFLTSKRSEFRMLLNELLPGRASPPRYGHWTLE